MKITSYVNGRERSKVMKKLTKVMSVVMTLVMLFALASTAFAAGEQLHHDGWSKYNYYTNDSVPQKNDRYLKCTSCSSGGSMKASAVEYRDGAYQVIAGPVEFVYGAGFIFQQSSYVRDIQLLIFNYGDSYGVNTHTAGTWTLYTSK